jgi:hypothetical protein
MTALSMSKLSSVAGPPAQWPFQHEIQAAPARHLIEPAIVSGHFPVVAKRVERREPGIAAAMGEEQLAARRGKSGEVSKGISIDDR